MLQSLPAEVQKHIEDTRAECRAYWNRHGIADPSDLWPLLVSSGDEGLISFTLSGARAVIVSDLHLCGDQCIKSVTCSTAGGSSFDIYVRTGQRLEECPLDHGLWSGILNGSQWVLVQASEKTRPFACKGYAAQTVSRISR